MGPKKLHQKLHHTLWFWQVLISKKPNKNAYLHDEKQGEEKRGSTPLGGANRLEGSIYPLKILIGQVLTEVPNRFS